MATVTSFIVHGVGFVILGMACGENNGDRTNEVVRTVRRRHLDEATKTGDSNEIDDRKIGMTLTKAEEFESTVSCGDGTSCAVVGIPRTSSSGAASDDSKLIVADKPDRTMAAAVLPSSADKETSQSRYYYEYVGGPTQSGSGEARRASSRGRSLVPTEPNTARPSQHQTDAADHQQVRKAGNSDMEDILDGFVKLLNGQPGQPGYRQPLKSRINNRGPPRISEATVVLEPPAFVPMPQHQQQLQPQPQSQPSVLQNKPKDPPPYPFDVPQPVRPLPPQPPNLIKPFLTGVPLPEQLVPTLANGGTGDDDDDSDQPSTYSSSSKRPAYHQTTRPQQEYDLFAPSHSVVATPERQDPVEEVTEKFTVPSSPPERTTEKPTTTTEKTTSTTTTTTTGRPTTVEKPYSSPQIDINATRVLGVQVSKVVDHLTSPVSVSLPVVDDKHNGSSLVMTITTTQSAISTSEKSETTLAGEHITGVGSAVVVLEPSTSEEPHRDDIHKPTDNNRLSGKPTTPIKKTPQQSGK